MIEWFDQHLKAELPQKGHLRRHRTEKSTVICACRSRAE